MKTVYVADAAYSWQCREDNKRSQQRPILLVVLFLVLFSDIRVMQPFGLLVT
ncbi:hypothetical protein [Burkholderia latens]|uniref:hypothetical protein n=1 Tax=Burkholderia latens TaxID=488446 RepID=UPI00147972A2|nr:hypothetical protein [Burkholderia latens]